MDKPFEDGAAEIELTVRDKYRGITSAGPAEATTCSLFLFATQTFFLRGIRYERELWRDLGLDTAI